MDPEHERERLVHLRDEEVELVPFVRRAVSGEIGEIPRRLDGQHAGRPVGLFEQHARVDAEREGERLVLLSAHDLDSEACAGARLAQLRPPLGRLATHRVPDVYDDVTGDQSGLGCRRAGEDLGELHAGLPLRVGQSRAQLAGALGGLREREAGDEKQHEGNPHGQQSTVPGG